LFNASMGREGDGAAVRGYGEVIIPAQSMGRTVGANNLPLGPPRRRYTSDSVERRACVAAGAHRYSVCLGGTMKLVVACLAVLCLVSAGTLVSRATAESSARAGSAQPTATHALAGNDVRVYFRHEAMPTMPLQWRRGVVTQADDRFITLSMSDGETLWVPMASVAYLESTKAAPTTRPS
jgi:hypothetical protein